MKILKFFLAILIIAITIFLSIGVFHPFIESGKNIELNVPVEQAFIYFSDMENINQLIPGYIGSELISGNADEAGCKYNLKIRFHGKILDMTGTLVTLWVNNMVVYQYENNMLTFTASFKFVQLDTGEIIEELGIPVFKTQLICHNNLSGANVFWKSLFYSFKSFYYEAYENLFHLLESKTDSFAI